LTQRIEQPSSLAAAAVVVVAGLRAIILLWWSFIIGSAIDIAKVISNNPSIIMRLE
jgi:hypothetical protein